jgi:hypothetical protein
MLDSSQSRDYEGGSNLTHSWSQVSGTSVTLSNSNTPNPTFTAPDVASSEDLVFEVTVTDDNSDTDGIQMTVTVLPEGTNSWWSAVPAEVGVDPDLFYPSVAPLLSPSMVIRQGKVLATKGDITQEGYIWSASKSLVALILGRLIHLGSVDLDDTVPGSDVPTSPTATYRQFASMVSDYNLDSPSHSPGDHWAYNNGAIHFYGDVMRDTFYTGATDVEFLEDAYATQIGCQDTITFGGYLSGWDGGWSMSTRDLARVCQLVLNGGSWNGSQLIDSSFINDLVTNQIPAGTIDSTDTDDQFYNQQIPLEDNYSFSFWLPQIHSRYGDEETVDPVASMLGAFGTTAYICPTKDLIVLAVNVGGVTVDDASVKVTSNVYNDIAASVLSQVLLSGTTAGTSSVTSNLEITKNLAGVIAGSSNLTSVLEVIKSLAGTIAGASSTNGSPTIAKLLAGGITGTSATSGEMIRFLAGAITGAAIVSGSLTVVKSFSGMAQGTSLTSGEMELVKLLAGAIAGAASSDGSPEVAKFLAGAIAGTSSVDGSPDIAKLLAGNPAGTSSLSSVIEVIKFLSGTSTGSSSTSGPLTLEGFNNLAGAIIGIGMTSGDPQVSKLLGGIIAGSSSTSGTPALSKLLDGIIAGSSNASGDPRIEKLLGGIAAGVGSPDGELQLAKLLSGLAAGQSTTSGLLMIAKLLSGTSTGVGTTNGTFTLGLLYILSMLLTDPELGTVDFTDHNSGTFEPLNFNAGTVDHADIAAIFADVRKLN